MAITITRSVTLLQKIKSSPFVKLNNEIYGGTSRILGGSELAEKTLLSNSDFLKAVLPTVVGLDSKSGKWQDVISKYFYSIEIEVPKGGKVMNIGMTFSLQSDVHAANIAKLINSRKLTIKTDEDLAEYVTGYDKSGHKHIEEIEYFKYGKPLDPLDYFNYVYCLYHNRVANTQELVSKSPRIEFYLVTKEDIAAAKRKRYEVSKRIDKVMVKLQEDVETFEAVCSILNITIGDEIDKGIALSELAKKEPAKVISAVEDKNLLLKARIEGYIRKDIIKRVPGSSMIVDSNDATLIIGRDMNSAMTFFSDVKNDGVLTQYASKYKSLS